MHNDWVQLDIGNLQRPKPVGFPEPGHARLERPRIVGCTAVDLDAPDEFAIEAVVASGVCSDAPPLVVGGGKYGQWTTHGRWGCCRVELGPRQPA